MSKKQADKQDKQDKQDKVAALNPAYIPDEEMERMRQQRFQERVQRVLNVMQREGIDWRGIPFIAQDGRIGTRVLPVDTRQQDARATTD